MSNPFDGILWAPRRAMRASPVSAVSRTERRRLDGFRGKKCNQGWMELESEEAKRLRGKGWWMFCRMIRQERGRNCQKCGTPEDHTRPQGLLHVHHILKRRTHRHLAFERSNVLLLCQSCHKKHEKVSEVLGLLFKDQTSSGAVGSTCGQRGDDLHNAHDPIPV